MGGHREELVQRYTAFHDKQRTTGTKTLIERVPAPQGPRLRAALHLNRDELKAALKDEVDLLRTFPPVVKANVRRRGIEQVCADRALDDPIHPQHHARQDKVD